MNDRIRKDLVLGIHAHALREIQQLLDGKLWHTKDIRKIAVILERAGYAVRTVEGERAYISSPETDHQSEYRDGNNSPNPYSKG